MEVSSNCLPPVSLSVEPEVRSATSSRKVQVRFLVQDDTALLREVVARGSAIRAAAASALWLEVAKAMAACHNKFAFNEEDREEGKLASRRLQERVQRMLVSSRKGRAKCLKQ